MRAHGEMVEVSHIEARHPLLLELKRAIANSRGGFAMAVLDPSAEILPLFHPNDYLPSFGVTSLNSPVDKSKTNPRMTTSEGIHGCVPSFKTCFCVARFTSE